LDAYVNERRAFIEKNNKDLTVEERRLIVGLARSSRY
jgi:hypothetical protein